MRKIIGLTFVSLDGVMQAPGGPQEDIGGSLNFAPAATATLTILEDDQHYLLYLPLANKPYPILPEVPSPEVL
jgi:hypothetical protein